MHDPRVALGDLRLALDAVAGLEVMLVPEVHLGAGIDRRLGQREPEAVIAHEQHPLWQQLRRGPRWASRGRR